MMLLTKTNIIFSDLIWENLSEKNQKKVCSFLSSIYRLKISKYLILPFCRRYRILEENLNQYSPGYGGNQYTSFQDFFTRKLKEPLSFKRPFGSPVEGYVCESGVVRDLNNVKVKGQNINVREIFGSKSNQINPDDGFLNIFLHNHNYHRFHMPTDGVITSIEHIPGKLLFLRPWFYQRHNVSFPSFVNERVVVSFKDSHCKTWFVTFVAGMGVGNIKINEHVQIGKQIKSGEELGLFYLGSTCCLIVPYAIKKFKYMEKISVGGELSL